MTGETLSQYVWDEQKALTESMKKSGRKDFWYSDIETAIVRAVYKERLVVLEEIMNVVTDARMHKKDLSTIAHYIEQQIQKEKGGSH